MKKRYSFLLLAVTSLALSTPVLADVKLAKDKNCMTCHAVDKKILGPAYKDIAAKYAGKKDAVAMLEGKVIKGGKGNWGAIAMPANPQVSAAEAKTLVAWILSQK